MPSEKYTMSSHDLRRVGELFAQGILAYALTFAADLIPQLDLGSFQPLAPIALLIVSELAKRYVQGPK